MKHEILHGQLTNTNIKIPIKKRYGDPPYPTMQVLGGKGGYFQKGLSYGSETSDMNSEGLEEMF